MKAINSRIRVFLYIFVGLGTVLILNLANIQIKDFRTYAQQAEKQFDWNLIIEPKRGDIFTLDKNNNKTTAASNEIAYTLYLNPKEITDDEFLINQLTKFISFDKDKISQKLKNKNLQYLIIKKYLTANQRTQIGNLNLGGVHFKEENKRIYPLGDFASQVIGFVGDDADGNAAGRYGIELFFDDLLTGSPGFLSQKENQTLRLPEDGADLVLTIDPNIQQKVEETLQKGVQDNKADQGTVIVVNPKSGNVLAMASYPSFDPNSYSSYKDYSIFQNPALSNYEPGSVMKAITIAGALNDNKLTPDTTYDDKGYFVADGYTLRNYDNKGHGIITVRHGMEKSYNTVAMFAEELMGHQSFGDYIQAFGFGKPTDITLPNESNGIIANLFPPQGRDVNYLTTSYGQGIDVTPLQMAQAFSVFANNGLIVKPQIVKEIHYADGRIKVFYPQFGNQPISNKALMQIDSILTSVVDSPDGSGHPAWLAHYTLAGKTGTAQIPNVGKPGYEPDAYIQTFIGFGPVSNPQFLMVVKMVNPKIPGLRFAETTVVPIFKQIAQFIIGYYNIPPDR